MSPITWFSSFSVLHHILYLLQLSHIELASTLSSIRKIVSSFPVLIPSQIIKESQEEERKCTLSEQEAKWSQIVKSARTGRHRNDCNKRQCQEVSAVVSCVCDQVMHIFLDAYFVEFTLHLLLHFLLLFSHCHNIGSPFYANLVFLFYILYTFS